MLEAGSFEYSHGRIYIHIVIFIKNVANFRLLTPKDIISLPKSLHVNQNGNVSIVSNLLEINSVASVK